MTSQPSYLRYLEAAKQAETADRLRAQGYVVRGEASIDGVEFDLLATKETQTVVYEFKAGKSARTNREALAQLQKVAADRGFEFRVVVVNPPPRTHVEIESLEEQLLQNLIDDLPQELKSLSTQTRVDGLSDIEISDIRVRQDEIKVSGRGSVNVELPYGDDSHEEANADFKVYDSYPFQFSATLGHGGELISVDERSVDTSSFSD